MSYDSCKVNKLNQNCHTTAQAHIHIYIWASLSSGATSAVSKWIISILFSWQHCGVMINSM